LAAGFQPEAVQIPKRFTALTTWKGKTDVDYLKALQHAYAWDLNVISPRSIVKHKDQTYYSALVAKPQIPRWIDQ
jgi:hypothetical protein